MGEKEAVVCDTNVLVSALAWRGAERQLYDACRDTQVRLFTSLELLDEIERTLHNPKLGFSDDEIAAFQADVRATPGWCSPMSRSPWSQRIPTTIGCWNAR